jgi:threonylcarbamoyladenosine tRNA methylthiotransferase MtaB
MNRTYTSGDFSKGIDRIMKHYNNIALGTDIILGFPGESDSRFQNTINMIDMMDFSYLHVFPYSARPGTKASSMSFQVPGPIKRMRVKEVRETSKYKKRAFITKNIGLDHQIIVETIGESVMSGTTSNYIKVLLPRNDFQVPGRLVGIRLTGIENEYALAIPITSSEPQDK